MWLSALLSHLGLDVYGVSLPADGRALSEEISKSCITFDGLFDINERQKLEIFLESIQPKVVIHLAAQSIVRYSYLHPYETFQTNVMGTANVIECALNTKSVECVAVVTSDKVYLNNNSGLRFSENAPLRGFDPYSASKVAVESVVDAWRSISIKAGSKTRILSLRAGNVIGGGDLNSDRLIPDLVRAYISGKPIEVRNPDNTRPWQHVLEPLFGYLKAIQACLSGGAQDTFNFGPLEKSMSVTEVVKIFDEVFEDKIQVSEDSRASSMVEAARLEIDSSKAQEILGWTPLWNQEESIIRTALWWKKFLHENASPVDLCANDLNEFLQGQHSRSD